ncbi:MAG: glycoside hydrolase family 43 protein [Lachnospiraceae bacterium]|nr:glycoside hydrolase family 43 protein [Lachnospiraceae bacterium]
MKKMKKQLTLILCLLLCFTCLAALAACGDSAEEDETTTQAASGDDSADSIDLSTLTEGNDSPDETVQSILANMLGSNLDADHIIHDLTFAFRVGDIACSYKVVDSDLIGSKGALSDDIAEDTEVAVYVKYTGDSSGECYFTFTVLASESAAYAYIDEVAVDLLHNTDNVRGNITLLTTCGEEDEMTVTWTSSDTSVITDEATGDDGEIPAGVVTRGEEDTVVTLTAEITYGEYTATKEFELTVIAAPEEKSYTKYLYTYFQGDLGNGESQNIFMATSEDGLFWTALNENEMILEATEGTGGVRDPFLLRSADGDHFYLIGTDLDASGGDWSAYGSSGSLYICVWESDDLVNWTEERLALLGPDGTGCMWAPEATYDASTGEYVVYWSAGYVGQGKQIWYAKTRDFYTFTEPQIYKSLEGSDTFIDTTMIEYDGTYYRFTKNETDLTILLETSDSVLGEFSLVKEVIADETGVEGPSIYQIFGEERWVLYMDGYAYDNSGVGYFPLIADSLDDLNSGTFRRLEADEYELPDGAKHGSFVTITEDEYAALIEMWG